MEKKIEESNPHDVQYQSRPEHMKRHGLDMGMIAQQVHDIGAGRSKLLDKERLVHMHDETMVS